MLKRIIYVSVVSRCLVLLVGTIASFSVSPYDSSGSISYGSMSRWLPTGAHWDSQYFVTIALNGYDLEHMHAFFPLLPLAIRLIAFIVNILLPGLPRDPVFMASGILFSNICFVLASVAMYRLSEKVFGKESALAWKSTVLFCFNPASVFMSSCYTESCFALCSFLTMYFLHDTRGNILNQSFFAGIFIALATFTRSNGVVLCGYLGFRAIAPFLQGRFLIKHTLYNLIVAFVSMVFAGLFPLGLVLYYGYSKYCLETQIPEWCVSAMPNIYGHVQATYWNQGFLHFYELKQIPNFVLAFPMTFICIRSIFHYATTTPLDMSMVPHILHLSFLLFVGLFCMHVQVITRFVSACPCIYWFCALKLSHGEMQWLYLYFSVFVLLGTSLFSCYYPWT